MSPLLRRASPLVAAVAGCALTACAGPPPDPPQLARIELTPIASAFGDHVLVLGLPGSTEPRVAVAAVDLDAPLAPTSGTVAADGSFLLEVPAHDGDALRLHTERDGRRSAPLDLVASLGPATVLPVALPCLRAPPLIELGAALAIENQCGAPAVVEELALRAPAPLEVRTATPLTIDPGGRAVVVVERAGTEPIDEVLLVRVSAPVVDRRAITIVAR